MVKNRMWMVRAGEGGYQFDVFKSENIVAIGWETGDLSNISTKEDIKKILKEKYPRYSAGRLNITAGQIRKFRSEFEKGDNVVTYDPGRRVYLIGEITSDYKYDTKISNYFHTRTVKWLRRELSRDKLSTASKNTLGAWNTIFEVPDGTKEEIIKLLKGEEPEKDEESEKEESEELLRDNTVTKARELIKDKISELDCYELQELVAGVLRGMGYKTQVSPRGPDRGIDIRASPDSLGLEEPRIFVQVKHRNGQVGTDAVKSFIAGLRSGKGLYVSTGGFSKDAKGEAERSNTPLTLIDLDMLVELIVQYYDNFDAKTKKLLPLVKIYWPE